MNGNSDSLGIVQLHLTVSTNGSFFGEEEKYDTFETKNIDVLFYVVDK